MNQKWRFCVQEFQDFQVKFLKILKKHMVKETTGVSTSPWKHSMSLSLLISYDYMTQIMISDVLKILEILENLENLENLEILESNSWIWWSNFGWALAQWLRGVWIKTGYLDTSPMSLLSIWHIRIYIGWVQIKNLFAEKKTLFFPRFWYKLAGIL